MDALAKACEVAHISLVPLPSESSTQSSGSNPEAEILEKRIDFIEVGYDDNFYPKTDQVGKQIGLFG
jgi:hypothetical protein